MIFMKYYRAVGDALRCPLDPNLVPEKGCRCLCQTQRRDHGYTVEWTGAT